MAPDADVLNLRFAVTADPALNWKEKRSSMSCKIDAGPRELHKSIDAVRWKCLLLAVATGAPVRLLRIQASLGCSS